MKVSEIKLVYKTKIFAIDRPKINSSKDAYKILIESWDKDHIELMEEFKIMLLNRTNRVLGIVPLSSGGGYGTVVDIRYIFLAAIKTNATSIILCHNHPSGDLHPSKNDDLLTDKIRKGGDLLEIKLFDHLVISKDGYFSYADKVFESVYKKIENII